MGSTMYLHVSTNSYMFNEILIFLCTSIKKMQNDWRQANHKFICHWIHRISFFIKQQNLSHTNTTDITVIFFQIQKYVSWFEKIGLTENVFNTTWWLRTVLHCQTSHSANKLFRLKNVAIVDQKSIEIVVIHQNSSFISVSISTKYKKV